jgi:hypothetical protein
MKPAMFGASFTFTQEEDACCVGGQEITVTVEDGGGGKYFAIKTERWAFDSPEELMAMLERVKGSLGDDWGQP